MPDASQAIFISYASDDAEAAARIADALTAAGLEVWFDKSELRGGDVWDQKIRHQIRDCALFIPIISAHTQARTEGYFRLEWRVADQRTHLMARNRPFIVPVCVDGTPDSEGDMPDSFSAAQWTRLPDGKTLPAFVQRITQLLQPELGTTTSRVRVPDALPSTEAASPRNGAALRPPLESRSSRRSGRLLWGLAAVVLVTVGYLVADRYWLHSSPSISAPKASSPSVSSVLPPASIPEKSIAVLPFADMSEKKDQEYLSDGLSEELIDRLTQIPGLRVPARTSSFYFKGRAETIETIARQLKVANVLEGSVRKSGLNLRITAQLIRANTGYHLWSQIYDRRLDDLFAVQADIANAVTSALRASLAISSSTSSREPANAEAHMLVLQGKAIGRSALNVAQFDKATEYMRRATKADPTSAEAWAWLADAIVEKALYGLVINEAEHSEMRDAIKRALALDQQSAEAHGVMGTVQWVLDWNWDEGLTEFKKSHDLDPMAANGNNSLGLALMTVQGATKQVFMLFEKAVELDPVSSTPLYNLSDYYMGVGQLKDAERAIRGAIDLWPMSKYFHYRLAAVLLLQGRATEALAEFQRETDEGDRLVGEAIAYFALSRKSESDAKIAKIEGPDTEVSAYSAAEAYAYRGERDRAFETLDYAYQHRNTSLIYVNRDPLLTKLHNDARWQPFLHKMKLPELSTSK